MRPLLFLLAIIKLSGGQPEYRQAVPGYHFQFPKDHFDHPEFRTEWWYYTGNLRAADGHRYGFELVFFRQGVRGQRDNPSAWRVDDLYLAHLALTDIDARRFQYFKRQNRAGPGIAGVSFDDGRIWNGNWESKWDKAYNTQVLSATAAGIRFSLRLTPLKPPVIQGENGISQKAAAVGRASYYVSFPRLGVAGTLNGAGVSGAAWMDHEWFTSQLDSSQVGWDWFSAQLDDNTEIMLFELRHADGSIDPYSAGTFVDRDGRGHHLKRADFELQPVAFWRSQKTGSRYPIKWRIRVPPLKLALECDAAIPNQELASEDAAGPSYWEGAVRYSGSVSGAGYLEMTGYDKPVRFE
jgi:predicted secreted hydrolase